MVPLGRDPLGLKPQGSDPKLRGLSPANPWSLRLAEPRGLGLSEPGGFSPRESLALVPGQQS